MPKNSLAPDWLKTPSDSNALALGVWPKHAQRNSSGEIQLAGVSLVELAKQFGTPLYLLDEQHVRESAEEFKRLLELEFNKLGASATVYYAGKAFLSAEIARWMIDSGLKIDVASSGELSVALAAGIDPKKLGLHGNNKSNYELETAVNVGIGTVIIDCESEIGRLQEFAARAGSVQAVRLRVRSGVHAHTHEHLATSHEDQKFGVSLQEAPRLVRLIRECENLEFLGLHSHIGSQIFGFEGFVEAISRLLALHKELLSDGPVPEINLGGGFGVAYVSNETAPTISEIVTALSRAVGTEAERLGIPVPNVCIEPGRAIIGPAGVTIYSVGVIKDVEVDSGTRVETRKYVSVDGGMSDNPRPALYQAEYSARIANRSSDRPPSLCRVVGKHCESGDIVVNNEYLPSDIISGDILAVATTGAYCWSLSSNYNYLPRPAVVAVTNHRARVIVRGESERDLLSRDAGLSNEFQEGEQ
ncbi:MAG: diaminopimelate decarboxylase [Microbacteriaceae bacterium]|nr:diaminopimelate decarboxylase [Microbacteriaceae bacterium]